LHLHVSAATGKQNSGRNNDKSASLPTIKKKRKKQLLKEILSSDGQQFHQYQRKEQSPLISNH
jgi:hypothetical protein